MHSHRAQRLTPLPRQTSRDDYVQGIQPLKAQSTIESLAEYNRLDLRPARHGDDDPLLGWALSLTLIWMVVPHASGVNVAFRSFSAK